jgi:UPF0176 protein
MAFQVLLYYKYTPLQDPETLMRNQKALCRELGLKGRIILAQEGINGTVEGETDATEKYVENLLSYPQFADMHIKRSVGSGSAFPKLSVKVRPEIVAGHLGEYDVRPWEQTGKHLTPEELHDWIHVQKRQFYIIDMRNDFEHKAGHFAGSILPPMGYFRELPQIVPGLEHLKDKTVVTVCTGGVRCEKASGFLLKHGFTDVYQLQGGIVSYMEQYPNQDFLGKLYVFDNRILMGFHTHDANHTVVGRCQRCQAPSERYVNCANLDCHKHLIVCNSCGPEQHSARCSQECEEVVV